MDKSNNNPVSILYKSIAGRYRPVRVADGPITARYRLIKNDSWETDSQTYGFEQSVNNAARNSKSNYARPFRLQTLL